MGKIVKAKGLKVISSFDKAMFPPNLGNRKYPVGKHIKFSFGAVGTEMCDKWFEQFEKLNDSTRKKLKKEGKKYEDLNIRIENYSAKKGDVNDLIFKWDITKVYDDKDSETGYKEVSSLDQKGVDFNILLKGEETEIFPYSGDTVDLTFELKLVKIKNSHRYAIAVHEINIIDAVPRMGGSSGDKKIEEIDTSDILDDLEIGDEDSPKKKVATKKTAKTESASTEEVVDLFADM